MTIEINGEVAYLNLLNKILNEGSEKTDRTGVGTISIFGEKLVFDLTNSFPILTTKYVPFKSVMSELIWFIQGSTDERYLAELTYGKPREELTDKKTIWYGNANADYWKPKAKFDGDLGKVYGYQWRNFDGDEDFIGTDQMTNLINGLKDDPFGRRHIVSAWNPNQLSEMALPPCHILFQCYVDNENRISMQMYQRSADAFLGVPFNISSYSALLCIIAKLTGYKPHKLHMCFGDVHIYKNHIEQVKEQLSREIINCSPELIIEDIKSIDTLKMSDFCLQNYEYHAKIQAPMAV